MGHQQTMAMLNNQMVHEAASGNQTWQPQFDPMIFHWNLGDSPATGFSTWTGLGTQWGMFAEQENHDDNGIVME